MISTEREAGENVDGVIAEAPEYESVGGRLIECVVVCQLCM